MSKVVLDASTVLAVLNREKGSEAIAQLMAHAIISYVNLSKVVAKLAEVGVTTEDIDQILSNLNLNFPPFCQ